MLNLLLVSHSAPPATAAHADSDARRAAVSFSASGFFSGFLPVLRQLFLFGFLFASWRFLFFVEQCLLFFCQRGAAVDIALPIEINLSINQGFLHHGVNAQRIVIVNGQIGVLADINRADAAVNAQLDRGIQSDRVSVRHSRKGRRTSCSWPLPDSSGALLRASSELTETTTPRSVISAALYGIASNASIL